MRSIGARLLTGSLFILGLGCFVSLTILTLLTQTVQRLTDVISITAAQEHKAVELQYDNALISDALRGYMLSSSDGAEKARAVDTRARYAADHKELLALRGDEGLTVEERARLTGDEMRTVETQLLWRVDMGELEEAKGLYFEQYTPLRTQSDELLEKLSGALARQQASGLESAATALRRAKASAWLLLLLLLGAGMAASLIMSRSLSRRIALLTQGVTRLAQGQLGVRVADAGRDDLGSLSTALNAMILQQRALIQQSQDVVVAVKGLAQHLQTRAQEMRGHTGQATASFESISASIETVVRSMDDVTGSMQQLSSYAQGSHAAVVQIAAGAEDATARYKQLQSHVDAASNAVSAVVKGIGEMNQAAGVLFDHMGRAQDGLEGLSSTVTSVAQASQASLELTHDVRRDSSAGMTQMAELQKAMTGAHDSVTAAAEAMRQLERRSDEITKITGVIEEVSNQTHLLAINASIIASQAGAQGQGFAVVAEEIRGMAVRTRRSTSEINRLVSETRRAILSSAATMEAGRDHVDNGMTSMDSARAALAQIEKSADLSTSKAQEIAVLSGAQTSAIQNVRQLMEQMGAASQRFRTISEGLRGSGEQIKSAVGSVRTEHDHVLRSSAEQQAAVKVIGKGVEQVSRKMEEVAGVAEQTRQAAFEIRADAEQFKRAQAEGAGQAQTLHDDTQQLQARAAALHEQMAFFSL